MTQWSICCWILECKLGLIPHHSGLVGDVAIPVSARQVVLSCAFLNPDARPRFDRHIWRSKISTHTKLRLYNVYILPVFLYGAETWSTTKAIERRINAVDQVSSAHTDHYVVRACNKLRNL